jgi:hypothetical protein
VGAGTGCAGTRISGTGGGAGTTAFSLRFISDLSRSLIAALFFGRLATMIA